MDILSLYMEALGQLWFIIPLFILVLLFQSRWFKGLFGELLVNRLLSQLPAEDYTIFKDITVPVEGGSTQINHIIVSKYGMFVIETKNMKGWIFGSETQEQWTQRIYHHTSRFQNPLHQNCQHIKALETLLNCPGELIHSVIVFVGNSRFKTKMPDNVTDTDQCLNYIRSINEPLLSQQETHSLTRMIQAIKVKPGMITDLKPPKQINSIARLNE